MRILIVEKGCTTELYAPPSLAGLCFALKDHFDNIERGYISIVFDKAAEREAQAAAAILNPSLGLGEEDTKPPGMGDVPH